MRKSNSDRPWRRKAIPIITLFLLIMALISVTSAWLNRVVNQMESVGFKMENSGTIMDQRYEIKTYFLDERGLWRLITTNYDRTNEEWASEDDTGALIPGGRTEYKTVITSAVPETQSVSLFLHGVSVDINLQDKIIFGVKEPDVIIHSCNDTDYFTNSGTELLADHLPLCIDKQLKGFDSLEVEWFINTGSNTTGGIFPALSYSDTPDTPITDGNGHYYFVNAFDNGGVTPKEAYRCNEFGVIEPGNHLYEEDFPNADYSNTTTTTYIYGNINQRVLVSGLYVAIG